ncbi:MAG: Ppx/GppA family phosphatase, partial [Stellaceae bacterium]
MSRAKIDAKGRLNHGPPVAVVDIGSNSVRLVVYEGLTRAPTELFNEKALCGLGREVQTTRLLAADAVQHALATLRRFRALCDTMGVKKTLAIATAACRDAKNGPAFIKLAERTIGAQIDVLSGGREAELTALGVISGVHRADGVVGDLGGGSLELVDVHGTRARHGLT